MVKRGVIALLSVFLLFALSVYMQAESTFGHSVRATIPFAFSVGTKAMPAGEYTVSVDVQSGRILLEGPSSYAVMTIPKEAKSINGHGRLVFQQDGDKFLLAEVWTPEDSTGQVLVGTEKHASRHAKAVSGLLEIQVSSASQGK